MAHDLEDAPRSGLNVQLCGDAHLANFGLFAAPDRRLVFSINDFDESLPGPFEWDVKRLVASFAVAARHRSFDDQLRNLIELACMRGYRKAMEEHAQKGWMDLWYTREDVDDLVETVTAGATKQMKASLAKTIAKSRSKDRLRAAAKLTHEVDGELRFLSTPPLVVPVAELFPELEAERVSNEVHSILRSYRRTLQSDRQSLLERYRYADLARKVVGVGSVGTRAWIVLMIGRDHGDPLILQVKEAQQSVLEPFLGKSGVANSGQRVVRGQWMMQAASDIMLGWHRTAGLDGVKRDFYVRQLWDSKGSADLELMLPEGYLRYADLCGRTLALAHARSGDPVAIASYLGTSSTFDQSMAVFAETYADQNAADHAALDAAISAGRVHATTIDGE
jgi:uncharacterized protein (DUF2252 family)